MSWISISEEHLAERLSAPEINAAKTVALGGGDPIPEVLAAVVAEVRGRVAAHRRAPRGRVN